MNWQIPPPIRRLETLRRYFSSCIEFVCDGNVVLLSLQE